jgi:hypothetical protein
MLPLPWHYCVTCRHHDTSEVLLVSEPLLCQVHSLLVLLDVSSSDELVFLWRSGLEMNLRAYDHHIWICCWPAVTTQTPLMSCAEFSLALLGCTSDVVVVVIRAPSRVIVSLKHLRNLEIVSVVLERERPAADLCIVPA